MRLPIVGVLGSGQQEHPDKAEPLGRWLAEQSVHLLTGGGPGVMAAVSRAFHGTTGRAGLVIGVLPGEADESGYRVKPGYPNPWVELPIRSHLPLSGLRGSTPMSRNHINVLSSDVLVALAGGPGTASELRLAVRYGKPVVAFLAKDEDIPDMPSEIPVVTSLQQVQAFVRSQLDSES